MADIELIIKLNEEDYINIKNAINSLIENGVERASMSKLCLAVIDGTPLPKGHGDLIDKNELIKRYKKDCGRRIYADNFIFDLENNTTTIIPAESEEKEEEE